MSTSGGGGGRGGICFSWRDTGFCRHGSNCWFQHVGAGGGGSGGSQGVCFDWQNTGSCHRGSSCRFQHVGPGGGRGAGANSSPRPVLKNSPDDTTRFLKHLSAVPRDKLGDELAKNTSMWERCWRESQSFDLKSQMTLLEVLAKTPGSSALEPPPLDSLEKLVKKIFAAQAQASDDIILTVVKTVLDAVERLLQFQWGDPAAQVKSCLESMIVEAEGRLKKQDKEHRPVGTRLIELLDDLDKLWSIKIRDYSQITQATQKSTKTPVSFADWKHADIKWLSNPAFFSPSSCPVMKVGNRGVYDSAEEYLTTVHRLWVAMTFADGHAALAPHCRAKGGNGITCNNALWPLHGSEHGYACRTPSCRHPAEFKCRISNHDGLCADCAHRSIRKHWMGPGRSASTHLYDGTVHRFDQDVIYLKEVKSRNPPPNAIHWRTSRRLSTSSLVGLVKIRSRGVALQEDDVVIWGEITFHSQSRDEAQRRERGQVAVQMSTISDLAIDPDDLQEGCSVALIDCMTFVPEWIPVLRAIEAQQSSRLPFNNGQHLNLCKEKLVKSNSCVSEKTPEEVSALPSSTLIDELIQTSQLEPIREICRDDDLRDELVAKLDNLVTATTLDTMQLISFVDSLRNPVHLTQGPPGTGKSYLGVVIVRALVIIRDLWVKKSRSTGSPPILVLSYKNHAIDEFLVDLTKAEPLKLTSNSLIRIGGQCKDQRLLQFSERNAYQTNMEVIGCRKVVEELHRLRDDGQSRRKATHEATGILMESIIRYILLQNKEDKPDAERWRPDTVLEQLSFLKVDDDRSSSVEVRRRVQVPLASDFIGALEQGIAHYEAQPHWGDILVSWISGKVPLPKCSFQGGCSLLALSPDTALCDRHRCRFAPGCLAECQSARVHHCHEHACQSEGCRQGKLAEAQPFCQIHSCKKCLELGLKAKLAMEKPPRNVCDDHPMCMVPSCSAFCAEDGMYCVGHSVVKCSATTKKRKPCQGKPLSRAVPFCKDHLYLANSMPKYLERDDSDSSGSDDDIGNESLEKDTVPQSHVCKGRTVNRKPCALSTLPGFDFCYVHKPPEDDQFTSHLERDSKNRLDRTPLGSDVCVPIAETVNQLADGAAISGNLIRSQVSGRSEDSESLSSSSSLAVNDANADRALIEPDETDLVDDNLQHLREVFEIQDREETDDESEDTDVEVSSNSSEIVKTTNLSNPNDWRWSMTVEERWKACHDLMDDLRRVLNVASADVKRSIVIARDDLKQAQIRAKARIYENKSIIGGTMVGCISRLEAIRATRPFAIVVEEASEVLEPLLFSCLSESTVKLEMIGDHRQLQPSVMSRYDFELLNKINVSMFQRLIEAPSGHVIPSTVLSLQRRMRKNICDLTRDFYSDIVNIKDHDSCSTKVIGQRLSPICSIDSATKGREVPGISPHVFLWTHGGAQSRSQVGISKVNKDEASMACHLVAYLVECGVPRESIAILTPYKGQLLYMREILLQDARLKSLSLISRDPQADKVCRLSTVDRFQGDEEDIIVCSLVVDENTKTAFVKLVNRMVVLLSRARIGLFVLGNTGYFENRGIPAHWERTLQSLRQPAPNDSLDGLVAQSESFLGIRSGPELPLCCPVHRSIKNLAATSKDLRLGFCSERCDAMLSCGHMCSQSCHWPRRTHNPKCTVKLDSPCSRHPGKIECHVGFQHSPQAGAGATLEVVLRTYKCPEQVDVSLPCTHVVNVPCWEARKFSAGEQAWPACNQPSPIPYTFPACGHAKQATCHELLKYLDQPTLVKCTETSLYDPPCRHQIQIPCWKREQYLEGSVLYICSQEESTVLPRCGHTHKLSCDVSRRLSSWTGLKCQEIGVVVEGSTYGQQDYHCTTKAKITRKCGHHVSLTCSEAFVQSKSLPRCGKTVNSRDPACGHKCALLCHEATANADCIIPDPIDEFDEGKAPSSRVRSLRCLEKVRFIKRCGHVEMIPCSHVGLPRAACSQIVNIQSLLCGHMIDIPCSLLRGCQMVSVWDSRTLSAICTGNRIMSSAVPCVDLSSFNQDTISVFQACTEVRSVELKCGHVQDVKCCQMHQYLLDRRSSECTEPTSIRLACGHMTSVTCSLAQRLDGGQRVAGLLGVFGFTKKSSESDFPKCEKTRQQKCWNAESCGASVRVPCDFKGNVACDSFISWTCPSLKHSFSLQQCQLGIPIDCPGCAADRLLSLISVPCSKLAAELAALVKNAFPADEIVELVPRVKPFEGAKKELVSQQQEHAKSILPGDDMLCNGQFVPCFRILKKQNQKADFFNPNSFAKPNTLHGILTKILSKDNILKHSEQRSRSKTITILLGYAFTAKTKLIETLPKDEQSKQKLLVELSRFDSVYYQDDLGFQNLIVLEPFPILALFRVTTTRDQLAQLSQLMTNFAQTEFSSKPVGFHLPPKGVINAPMASRMEDEGGSDDDDESDDESVEENLEQDVERVLQSTMMSNFVWDLDWPGYISSDGSIPQSVEDDLMDKMQFFNPQAKPFTAIRLIEAQMAKNECYLFHLLKAAEMLRHDPTAARQSLENYLRHVKGSPTSERCHPLALVVASRVEPSCSKSFLYAFVRMFPAFRSRYLTADEVNEMKVKHPEISIAAMSWKESIILKWTDLKNRHGIESAAMDSLLQLTGLRKVKEEALRLWQNALQLKKIDEEARRKNSFSFNYCFLGGPGTGKTTVARLFTSILHDSELRQNDHLVQTTAQKAKDDGPDEFRKLVATALGGVLFIDEAYDLDPVGDFKGRPIVNELLTLCEDRRDEITVVLAGYEDDFQRKFFAYNEGLKSRFREVLFEDFDEVELSEIWTKMRVEKGWREDPDVCSVITRRMARSVGTKGFGNAREVRRQLELATQTAMRRLGDDFSMEKMVLQITDVIGEDPRLGNEKLVRVQEEINEKIGWNKVKSKVAELVDLCARNYQLEILGKPTLDIFMNRLLLGNPGTGKTTCAKLYGRLLKELGFLSNGDVVSKTASDFIGEVIGSSQNKTNAILEGARGKVLIIDEAYALDDNHFGKKVLDTLVEKVQGHATDDIAVLLVGYEEQMLKMIRTQNPGLARRFPQEHAFYFDDYDENELLQILDLNLKRSEIGATFEFRQKAISVLQQQREQANFGNAGAVELLVKGATLKASQRIDGSGEQILLDDCDIEDPGLVRSDKDTDPLSQLDSLYRMELVKEKLEGLRMAWSVARRDGEDPPPLGHFVFTGSPGTGKTTVARVLAKILFGLGLKPSDKILETNALDLQADYEGQTKTKVNEVLSEAKGGVLFIDEAYNLGLGRFGKEACDTLVPAMTSKEFANVLIVIAGYPVDIEEMFNSNSGLKSRFTHFFDFPDWTPEDCQAFFQTCAKEEKYLIEDGVLEVVQAACEELISLDGWANGRDVRKIWDESKFHRAVRVYSSDAEPEKVIVLGDLRQALASMLQNRKPKSSVKRVFEDVRLHAETIAAASDQQTRSLETQQMVAKTAENNYKKQKTASELGESTYEIDADDETEADHDERDAGVSDEEWQELQFAKVSEKTRLLRDELAADAHKHYLEQYMERLRQMRLRFQAELDRIQREVAEHQRQEAIRKLEEEEKREQMEMELERRKEEERQRLEETRKRQETLQRLQKLNPCPWGFSWYKIGGGWRCGGGAHYVSDEQLRKQFTSDI